MMGVIRVRLPLGIGSLNMKKKRRADYSVSSSSAPIRSFFFSENGSPPIATDCERRTEGDWQFTKAFQELHRVYLGRERSEGGREGGCAVFPIMILSIDALIGLARTDMVRPDGTDGSDHWTDLLRRAKSRPQAFQSGGRVLRTSGNVDLEAFERK